MRRLWNLVGYGKEVRGNLLLTGEEKAVKLREKLRSLGVNPDEI